MINSRKWRAALKRLWQWDIAHLQPGQPLSWRFILPNQSPQIRLHRHLWWHSRYKLPSLLWLPLELMRWLHWQCWAAKRKVREAAELYGAEIEQRFGIPVADQKQQIGYWAKAWCISPYTAYNWQLYRKGVDALGIIYANQASAYHALRNQQTGATKADHRLLSDKIALAEKLTALGIPMVETARLSNGDWRDLLDALQQQPKLFCKLRSGNQGESAFAVWQSQQGMQGQCLDGRDLPDKAAIQTAWHILANKGALLIQPLLVNHPDVANASSDHSAIIVRLVTQCQDAVFSAWWAELQVPATAEPGSTRGFWRFSVPVIGGTPMCMPSDWLLKQHWCDQYQALFDLLPRQALPFWAELIQHSTTAHTQLPNVWAIAWDWVLTPNGPVLLEGNSGWGLDDLQQQGVNLVNGSEAEFG